MSLRDHYRQRFPQEPSESLEQYELRLSEIIWAHGMAARQRHAGTTYWDPDARTTVYRDDGILNDSIYE